MSQTSVIPLCGCRLFESNLDYYCNLERILSDRLGHDLQSKHVRLLNL